VPKRIELPSADELFGPTGAAHTPPPPPSPGATTTKPVDTRKRTASKNPPTGRVGKDRAARNATVRPPRRAVAVTDALARMQLAETRLVDLSVEDLVSLRDRLEDLLAAPDVSRRELDRLLRSLP